MQLLKVRSFLSYKLAVFYRAQAAAYRRSDRVRDGRGGCSRYNERNRNRVDDATKQVKL